MASPFSATPNTQQGNRTRDQVSTVAPGIAATLLSGQRCVVNWRTNCGADIPWLNESATIEAVVRAVLPYLPTVVVVDDGSSDSTARRAKESGATVLRHSASQGKGAALTTGLRYLRESHFQWALLMDGDGQHAAEDIPLFFRKAQGTAASMIVGNRMAQSRRIPWLRRQVNYGMSAWLSWMTGYWLADTQCGFRLLQVPVWERLTFETAHFEFESELLFAFLQARQRVEFVPIHVIYGSERTKINPLTDTLRWFAWCWNAWWGRTGQNDRLPELRRGQSKSLLQSTVASVKLRQ